TQGQSSFSDYSTHHTTAPKNPKRGQRDWRDSIEQCLIRVSLAPGFCTWNTIDGSVANLTTADLVGRADGVLPGTSVRKAPLHRGNIVTCVRWYLRFSLSLSDVEELMAERGLSVDHTTVWRWTLTYAPEAQKRLRGQVKPKGSTWHMDETFVRIAGHWMYLFRAVDSAGQTVDLYLSETRYREAAKCFL